MKYDSLLTILQDMKMSSHYNINIYLNQNKFNCFVHVTKSKSEPKMYEMDVNAS